MNDYDSFSLWYESISEHYTDMLERLQDYESDEQTAGVMMIRDCLKQYLRTAWDLGYQDAKITLNGEI